VLAKEYFRDLETSYRFPRTRDTSRRRANMREAISCRAITRLTAPLPQDDRSALSAQLGFLFLCLLMPPLRFLLVLPQLPLRWQPLSI
jgi:hypothetical protein